MVVIYCTIVFYTFTTGNQNFSEDFLLPYFRKDGCKIKGGSTKESLLHTAAVVSNHHAIEIMLKAEWKLDADQDLKNADEETPFHCVAQGYYIYVTSQ